MLDIIRRLFRPPAQRASATTRLDVQAVSGANAVWTTSNYDALAREGYEISTWVFACINQLTRQTAYVRPLLYQTDRRGRMIEIDDHPLLQLISRPNEDQALEAFLETAYATRLLSGNTFIERVGLENRPPVELYVKRPDRMRAIPGRDTRVAEYEYRINGQTLRFNAWQILHLRTFHPRDDYYGLSPLAAAARGVDVFNAGQAHNLAMLQNGARPTGAWVSQTTLTDDQYESLRAQINEASAFGARGRPLLLEGGIDWKELGLNPRDLDFLAGQEDAARQIHAVYGVHPVLTGLQTGTYDNQREASRALLNMAVFPFLDMLFGELTRWIAPTYGPGLRLTFDRQAFPAFSEDEAAMIERSTTAFKNGVLTRNEARLMLGYEPVENGDAFADTATPTQLLDDDTEINTRQDTYTPTKGMREEAARGLEWRAEYGRGGTAVGVARARDISNGRNLPIDTVRRMNSYFARHEVDKEAEGFRPGEPGFPSAGRIAWALWGGDAGQSWARAIIERENNRAEPTQLRGINPSNEREAELYRQTRVLLQDVWIERIARTAATEFERERRALTTALENAPADANANLIAEQVLRANTFPDLTATWLAAAVAGGEHALDSIETTEERQQRQDLPTNALLARIFGLAFDTAIQYARRHSSKLITEITDTTVRQVQERITRGVTEGLRIPDIAKLIDELYLEQIIPNRSTVIARTETIRATNYGAGAAARGTGLDLVKGWLATTDGFAREGHVEAMNRYRNNPIPIDSTFEVAAEPGGQYENLDYPGDPSGSPENTIQCRCAPFYRERSRTGRPA